MLPTKCAISLFQWPAAGPLVAWTTWVFHNKIVSNMCCYWTIPGLLHHFPHWAFSWSWCWFICTLFVTYNFLITSGVHSLEFLTGYCFCCCCLYLILNLHFTAVYSKRLCVPAYLLSLQLYSSKEILAVPPFYILVKLISQEVTCIHIFILPRTISWQNDLLLFNLLKLTRLVNKISSRLVQI